MEINKNESETRKSLYIFLCSLLGIMLFVMLQKAALLLLTLFLGSQTGTLVSTFGNIDIAIFDTVSYILALFFGGWYGVWLGLHWYGIVYESGRGGITRALFNHAKDLSSLSGSRPSKPVVTQSRKETSESKWQFEDLVAARPEQRPARVDDMEWSRKVSVKKSVPVEEKPKRVVKK
jgi:hypothetical protein